nr:class I SAM-dependent methyltransferase [uncultured Lachnoclostridium sp.]
MSEQYQQFLKFLNQGAKILDLGCGSGRDSKYFIDNGYKIIAIDGSEKLCEMASHLIGQQVKCMDFENISFENEFDGVWACASLLHVDKKEIPNIMQKLNESLKQDGVIYCSFKYGEKAGHRNGRYFLDMTEELFENLISKVGKYKVLEMYVTGDVRVRRDHEKWLNVVLKKSM